MNEGINILLVEDFNVIRKAQARTLSELGFSGVIEAADGEAAVEILGERSDIHLIISDWNMPGMDGLALLRWVRSHETHGDVPFLIATAKAERRQAEEARRAGVSAFITKPFDAEELRSAVDTALGRETAAEAPPAVKRSTKTRLRIAHIQITDHLALGVLDHLIRTGERNPRRFELETRCMPSWNPFRDALGRGEVDGALVLAPMAMDFFNGGLPVRLILFAHRGGSICVRNAEGGSPGFLHEYLKGKTLFLPHVLSVHHMLADMFLREIGLKLGPAGEGSTDVFYEVVPPVRMPEYLADTPEAGGFIVAEPMGTRSIHEGVARPLFLSGELWENHPCCVLLMRREATEAQEEATHELVESLVAAGRFIDRNPEAAARIAVDFLDPEKRLGLSRSLLESVLTEPKGVKMDDMFPVLEDLDKIQRYMASEMGIGGVIDLERFVDLRFARSVLGERAAALRPSTLRDAAAIVARMIGRRMADPPPDAPPKTFAVTEEDGMIRFEISSEMHLVDRVVGESRRFLNGLGYETFSEFKLVLRELLINAIEHGNRNRPDLTAACAITLLPNDVFEISVADQGDGFDHRGLDMAIPQDSRQIRNRGYAIINAYSMKIEFNETGNRVSAYVRIDRETRFETAEEGEWMVIRPTGDITAAVADKFRTLLDRCVEKGHTRFRFDLEQVQDIDSVGLSAFLILHKILSGRPVALEMENVNDDLRQFFRMIRLDQTYTIRPRGKGDA